MESIDEISTLVEFVDTMTGGVINHINYTALNDSIFLEKNGLSNCPIIDIDNTKFKPIRQDGGYWKLDPDLVEKSETDEELSTASSLLIDYGCLIHLRLLEFKKVIIVSQRGISPYVICAFYLLRGVSYYNVGYFLFIFTIFISFTFTD